MCQTTPEEGHSPIDDIRQELTRLLHWSNFWLEDGSPFGFKIGITASSENWIFRLSEAPMLLRALRSIPQEPQHVEQVMKILRSRKNE
jgi:hypothetical protein